MARRLNKAPIQAEMREARRRAVADKRIKPEDGESYARGYLGVYYKLREGKKS